MKTLNPNVKPYIYAFAFFVLLIIMIFFSGCHIQQRIEEAKKEAVRQNRAEFPCINDSLIKYIPGTTVIQHDTTNTLSHDTTNNTFYDTVRITKTIYQKDTIQITVKDVYLINSLKDSLNAHRIAESNLKGQLIQEKVNTATGNKLAKDRLAIIIGICSLIAIILGLTIYFKFFTASGTAKSILTKI